MQEVRPAVERQSRQRRRLPARREQQLPADRPVEPGELDEGQREIGRQPQDEARRPGVRQDGAAAARRSKRAGRQRLGLRTAAALGRLLLHLLDLRGDLAGLGVEAGVLVVMLLELLIASSGNEHQSLFFSM